MKTITIGDIHGSAFWRNVDVADYDKVIFVGDYTDHWTFENDTIERSLKDIIKLKQDNPDKVELLLGNHDLQYMFSGGRHSCSGLRPEKRVDWKILFNDNKELFKAAYYEETMHGKYLWTHAGLTNAWYVARFMDYAGMYDNLGEALNAAFNDYRKFMFDVGYDRYGMQPYGGPFWADRQETMSDMLRNVHQIVGHSRVDEIKRYEEDVNTSITYVDVFEGDNPDFYKLEI